jgi:WD40 repeat protein
MFHPELPIILTGSEDGSVRIWHSTTYRLENTLNYGMQRVWALAVCKGTNQCASSPTDLSQDHQTDITSCARGAVTTKVVCENSSALFVGDLLMPIQPQ